MSPVHYGGEEEEEGRGGGEEGREVEEGGEEEERGKLNTENAPHIVFFSYLIFTKPKL